MKKYSGASKAKKKCGKLSRTTLRNKLDKVAGEIVRARGKCQRCGNTETLQNCHVYSRTYNATRWDIDNNLLCLCASCHFWGHKNPLEFAQFVRELLGQVRFEMLQETRNQITKFTYGDLQLKLKVLNEIKDSIHANKETNKS